MMKWIRVTVMALVIAPALLAGPMASRTCAGGLCSATVEGTYGQVFIPGLESSLDALAAASQKANDGVASESCADACERNGCIPLSWDPGPQDVHVIQTNIVGPMDAVTGEYVATAQSSGYCQCEAPGGGIPMANGKPVPLTFAQKVQKFLGSLFTRPEKRGPKGG